jgi:ribose 5-phosphate isomerase B
MDSILNFLVKDKSLLTVKLSISNDHGGYDLAMSLIKRLKASGMSILYYGAFSREEPVDYPDYAKRVTDDVISARSNFGILICRSGTGMCIAANKMDGIRAANCQSTKIAKLAREHNNANVLCLGSDFVKPRDAKNIVDAFANTKFAGGRHERRIKKITALESAAQHV